MLRQDRETRGGSFCARQIATGENQPVALAGVEKLEKKVAVGKPHRRRKSQKAVRGTRAHRGDVAEVDGEKAAGESGFVDASGKMGADDLEIDSDDPAVAGAQDRSIVAEIAPGSRLAAEPVEKLSLSRPRYLHPRYFVTDESSF